MIKIAIVEDNATIREGIKVLLDGTQDLECVGAFETVEDFLEVFETTPIDVILMDIELPGMSGIECVKIVKSKTPETLIIMLTVYEDRDYVFEALCNGAEGYLLKNTPPAQLIDAIIDAHNGGSPMSSQIARKVVRFFSNPNVKKEKNQLSAREQEVLEKLSLGNSYKMIADQLFISTDTVRYHIRNIYQKLQVHSQSEAVAKALKKGWI